MDRIIKRGEKLFRPLSMDGLELKSIDEEKRILWHPITREVPDRYGDIVRIEGINVDQFLKKPGVLYGHDYRSMNPIPVIGKGIGFERKGDILYAGTQFLSVDTPGMSQALKDLINDNWLLQVQKLIGWSIGFMVDEWTEIKETKSYDFKRSSLIEYSSVIIPAHQDAVNDQLKSGRISGAVVKFFDMKTAEPESVEPRPAHADPAAGIAVVKEEGAAAAEPGSRGLTPEPIHHEEPAIASAPESTPEHTTGGSMLEKIFEKLAKGEKLTDEEQALYDKAKSAFAAPAPAPAPVRKLDLVDAGGVKVRSMTDIMNQPHGVRTMSGQLNEVERELQEFAENAYIVATLLGKSPRQLKMWDNTLGRSSALSKALDAATATEGSEWVPTLLSADFISKFRLQAKVASLFNDFAMPSNPWKMPYFGGLSASNFYFVGESTSDEPAASPSSTPATGDQTLTAKKLKARILFSDELVEDSIVPVIEALRADLVTAGAECIEDIILNGDTTATHMDSDVVDSKDRRKAWNGLRDLCPSGTKASLATWTATSHVQAFITLMGKYGINPAELAFITGGVGYSKFRGDSNVITVDKYGPQAVVLNGELGKLLGSPIIISEYIRENLNATGVYDGSTTTKTELIIVNRRGFMLGTRGGVKLTFKAEAEVDQNQLIMSFRKAFQARWTPAAAVQTIAIGYNVA
jgi:HK97 family phage major capsid protein